MKMAEENLLKLLLKEMCLMKKKRETFYIWSENEGREENNNILQPDVWKWNEIWNKPEII